MDMRKCIAILIGIFLFGGIAVYSQPQQGGGTSGPNLKEEERKVWGWYVDDYRPYIRAFKDLERLTREYADDQIRIALDYYITGIDILRDMREDIQKMYEQDKTEKHLNEKWYWQEIDRKNTLVYKAWRMKQTAKQKAAFYFIKAIKTLDNIENDQIKKTPEFRKFMSYLYQIYVSVQYDIGNIPQTIPILERYLEIDERNKGIFTLSLDEIKNFEKVPQQKKDVVLNILYPTAEEKAKMPKDINEIKKEIIEVNRKATWAYRYLAQAYAFKENLLRKIRDRGVTEAEIEYYRKKKNEALLKATQLRYGKDSPQYKKLFELVQRDEKLQRYVRLFQ